MGAVSFFGDEIISLQVFRQFDLGNLWDNPGLRRMAEIADIKQSVLMCPTKKLGSPLKNCN